MKEWTPYLFDGEVLENNPTPPCEQVKGAGICLWSDTPAVMTEDEVLENMRPYFTAIAKKTLGLA
jgi:hypothetical protein